MRASALRATTSATLRALELAVAFSPSDFTAYRAASAVPSILPPSAGFQYSGSHAARNIEKIYAAAERAGVPCSLESALDCCFGEPAPLRHVLVCSGFFVLHGRGGAATAGLDDAAGTCETDGPLGALALLRALVARGAAVSLLCDAHNGPVLRAAYDAMLSYVEAEAGGAPAALLRERSRCLPTVWDRAPPGESADEAAAFAGLRRDAGAAFDADGAQRALRTASQVGAAVRAAWADAAAPPGQIDGLFAIERLGAPYRNIRGRDISAHTEPIDVLWPPHPAVAADSDAAAAAAADADAAALDAAAVAAARAHLTAQGLPEGATAVLRRLAGCAEDARTLAIGDGGNEVGMGRVALLRSVAALRPGGADFVALSANGCYRACDALLLGTVSNWAATAFELGAHVDRPPADPDADCIGALRRNGRTLADLEAHVLAKIMAPAVGAVDGAHHERPLSVDGMPFEPHHRALCDRLWELAGLTGEG